MAKQLSLKDRLISAGRLASRSYTHARLWWNLTVAPARTKHEDVIVEYWDMLGFTVQAHLLSFVVGSHALHHDRAGTVNFHALSRELSGAALAPIRQGAAVHRKIEILRHQAFAHRSDKRTYDDAFKAANITSSEVLDHASLTLAIANELLRSGRLDEVFVPDLPERTADRMLSDLARSLT